MIKVDELRKYWDIRESNIRADYEKDITTLKTRYEKNVKELETEFDKLISFRNHMVETVTDTESFFLGYYNLFNALPEEKKKELLKKYPDIVINWTAKKSS